MNRGSRKNALIIEGDRFSGQKLEELLRGQGWEATETFSSEDGILYAEMEQPSLIILDMASDCFDGFSTFKHLRESYITSEIPIIALTDGDKNGGIYYTPEDFEAAFDVPGPEGIVDKPVDPRYLLTCIMGVMG